MSEETRKPDAPAAPVDENKLIAERRAKLAAWRETAKAAGVPAFPNDYRRDVLATLLAAEYGAKPPEWFETNSVRVHVAGRMMFQRIMGKAQLRQAAGPHRADPDLPATRCVG